MKSVINLIQEKEVIRNSYGEWTHPDLPDWGEYVDEKTLKEWKNSQLIELYYIYFEQDAPEKLIEDYFVRNETNLSEWKPKCPHENSFLIAIFDGEEGGIAIFAVERKEREYVERVNNF